MVGLALVPRTPGVSVTLLLLIRTVPCLHEHVRFDNRAGPFSGSLREALKLASQPCSRHPTWRSRNIHRAVADAAMRPASIDVYFQNVGGAVCDALLPLLNDKARIPCAV